MGQQHGVPAHQKEWDTRSTFSTSSKRFRHKLRKSFRVQKHKSCRDLSETYQYSNSTDQSFELLNLNTASEDELMTLTGITRQTAKNIIEHRSKIGGFRKVEDLALVSGVGAARLQLLRNDVCVRQTFADCGSQSLNSLSSVNNSRLQNKVNINTATMFDLMSVPGLTQELAAAIIHNRNKKQRFKSLQSLLKIKGMNPSKFILLRPYLTIDSDDSSTSFEIESETVRTPATPSLSMRSRKSRRTDTENTLDYDVYRLISHLVVRPVASRTEFPATIGSNRLRVALWDLDELTSEKISNLGVQEVICRTLLENEISILVIQDVRSVSVGEKLMTELNQPSLSRVASWEPQERNWQSIFLQREIRNGQLSGSRQNTSGFLYSASNGLRHLETFLVDLSPKVSPASICHFELNDFRMSLVSVDLRSLNEDILESSLSEFIRRISSAIGEDSKYIVVCGNFLASPTHQAFDEMIRLGFHLLHPISCQEDEHLHVWCSSGAEALCTTKEASQIKHGLSHPMIPKSQWSLGGTVSSHKPIMIELNIKQSPSNGIYTDHVLKNGMISTD